MSKTKKPEVITFAVNVVEVEFLGTPKEFPPLLVRKANGNLAIAKRGRDGDPCDLKPVTTYGALKWYVRGQDYQTGGLDGDVSQVIREHLARMPKFVFENMAGAIAMDRARRS